MAKRRRWSLRSLAGGLAGAALAPTSALTLYAAVKTLGGLGARGSTAGLFLAGMGGYAALYLFGLRLRRAYVFAHELTHALAAWMWGARVLGLKVGAESGSISLSRSNAFVALAPYWIPLYALILVGAYRLLLWAAPGVEARGVFLVAMGAGLSFHLMHTAESLWTTHQDDLDDAGFLLSLSLIALLNGAILLAAMKCLFPDIVGLGAEVSGVWRATRDFWLSLGGMARAAAGWLFGLLPAR